MNDCIFCKIIAKELPCHKVYENDRVLAFLDINPGSRGHTLVIPKKHAKNIHDIDQQDLQAVIIASQKIANAMGQNLKPDGLNLHQSNNEIAGQVVMHFHMHVIPRYQDDNLGHLWKPGSGGNDFEAVLSDLGSIDLRF